MANRYTGNEHKYGVVAGSFINMFLGIIASIFFFYMNFVFGITAVSFALTNLIFGLYDLHFGGKVKFSLNKKPSDAPGFYKFLSTARWIMVVLFILLLIVSTCVLFGVIK